MHKHKINANLVSAIEHLYDRAINAVQMNGTHENVSEQQLEEAMMSAPIHPLPHFSRKGYV